MVTNNSRAINNDRAGSYFNQIGGYKAFVPKPLPPDPPIQLDSEMILLLSQAAMAIGRLVLVVPAKWSLSSGLRGQDSTKIGS